MAVRLAYGFGCAQFDAFLAIERVGGIARQLRHVLALLVEECLGPLVLVARAFVAAFALLGLVSARQVSHRLSPE